MDCRIWQGEQRIDSLRADDRGLAYGDGLFETVRVIRGNPVLMEWHWARLSAGCARLGLPDLPFWRDAFDDFLVGRGEGIAKLQVTRGSGGRGYLPPFDVEPVLILSWHALPDYPVSHSADGIAVGFCQLELAIQPALAGIKHLNRLEQVLLRKELVTQPGCAEAVVCDSEGRVVEGVFSNLFLVRRGELITPDLARCGVRGVLRDALIEAAADAGLPVSIASVSLTDCGEADEWFFCNSVYGIWPVRRWGERAWRPGPITRQCQDMISAWFSPA